MDGETDAGWWELHRRAASGGSLTPEERADYEAGLRHRHQQEPVPGSLRRLRVARARVAVLEAQYQALRARRRDLDAEIDAVESALSEPTRQLLAAGG